MNQLDVRANNETPLRLSRTLLVSLALISFHALAQDVSLDEGRDAGTESASGAPNDAPADQTGDAGVENDALLQEIRAIEELDLAALLNIPVVTASGGRAQSRAEAPANVVVIGHEEIALHGWRSLGEVLSNTLGFYVIDDGVQPSIGVRGVHGGLQAGTRIVKMMINGEQVNFRPTLSAFIGPEFIPIEAIHQIEVAKGPLSALYGANALLAVVNVITKDPRAKDALNGAQFAGRGVFTHERPGVGGTAFASWGNADRGLVIAYSHDFWDRSGIQISKTYESQDVNLSRYSTYLDTFSANDTTSPQSGFAQFITKLGEGNTLMLQGGLQRINAASEFQLNSLNTHLSRIALDNLWSSLKFERVWNPTVTTSLQTGYSWGGTGADYRLFLSGNTNSSFRPQFFSRSFSASAKTSLNFEPHLTLDVGVDFAHDFQSALFYDETFYSPLGQIRAFDTVRRAVASSSRFIALNNIGLFVQASSTPIPSFDKLQLTANLRLDLPNLFDAQFTWRAAALYIFKKDVSVKLIVGQAFQAPSGVLLFGQGGFGTANNVIGSYNVTSGPRLNPQRASTVEAVFSSAWASVLLDVAAFGQIIDSRIELVQVGANFRPVNQGQLKSAGGEARARWTIGYFSLYAQAGLSIPVDVVTPLYPMLSGRGGVDFSLPIAKLKANAQARFATNRPASQSNVLLNNRVQYDLPAYVAFDLSIMTEPLPLLDASRPTQFSFAVHNLLDSRWAEPAFGGFDMPNFGRTMLLQVVQQF